VAAFEPTVLNCFLFRQTDLIPGGAAGEGTAPFDLNQQRRPGKMKGRFAFRLHDEGDPTEWALPKQVNVGRESINRRSARLNVTNRER
jgi:hypothetical protein